MSMDFSWSPLVCTHLLELPERLFGGHEVLVGKHDDTLLVVHSRKGILGVNDDQRTAKAIGELQASVSVVPITGNIRLHEDPFESTIGTFTSAL